MSFEEDKILGITVRERSEFSYYRALCDKLFNHVCKANCHEVLTYTFNAMLSSMSDLYAIEKI